MFVNVICYCYLCVLLHVCLCARVHVYEHACIYCCFLSPQWFFTLMRVCTHSSGKLQRFIVIQKLRKWRRSFIPHCHTNRNICHTVAQLSR